MKADYIFKGQIVYLNMAETDKLSKKHYLTWPIPLSSNRQNNVNVYIGGILGLHDQVCPYNIYIYAANIRLIIQ